MKAIILAAGRGSRLGKLTENNPKCMVELKGKPLIEWQLDALRKSGNGPIAIVTGYRGEMLHKYADKIFTNERWNETNMVASLLTASEWLSQEDCIISYSDIFYPADAVEALVKAHEGGITVGYDPNWLELWSKRFENPLTDAETFETDEQGNIVRIGEKPKSLGEVKGQYMGLLVIGKEGWKEILNYLGTLSQQQVDKLDMTSLLRSVIGKGYKIKALPLTYPWGEVDAESDLKLYEKIYNSI